MGLREKDMEHAGKAERLIESLADQSVCGRISSLFNQAFINFIIDDNYEGEGEENKSKKLETKI